LRTSTEGKEKAIGFSSYIIPGHCMGYNESRVPFMPWLFILVDWQRHTAYVTSKVWSLVMDIESPFFLGSFYLKISRYG